MLRKITAVAFAAGAVLGGVGIAAAAEQPCRISIGNGHYAPCPPVMPQGGAPVPGGGSPLSEPEEPSGPTYTPPEPEEEAEPTTSTPTDEPTTPPA